MESLRVDITQRELEPIHVPGLIQPHGVLLAMDGPIAQRHKGLIAVDSGGPGATFHVYLPEPTVPQDLASTRG